MKKIIALLMSLMMIFAFTACGSSEPEPEPEPDTTTEAVNTHVVTGLVEEIADANLSIYTEADQSLTFNIENADIQTEDGFNKGDTATVEYEGEISNGDTSGCKVISVTDVAGAETTIEGKVESINSDGTVTISSNSKKYTFKTDDVKSQSGSVKPGDTVSIKFAGIIEGDDTSHAYVRSMEAAKTTEATEKADNNVSLKAVNETVWASADVNVRDGYSTTAGKVATVKKGTKLTRTGVLSNGWSRVKYKDKDRYIASSYLTTKDPKKKETKTKATESKTKATESKTKATESKTKATETKSQTATKSEPTQTDPTQTDPTQTDPTQTDPTQTDPTQTEPPETEPPETEPPETEPPETEPATITAKGVVTSVDGRSLTLDNGKTFNIAGATLDVTGDEAMGQTVAVEYYEGSSDAVHVYLVGGDKAVGATESNGIGGGATAAIILALLAIAAAIIIVVVRNRRKPKAE